MRVTGRQHKYSARRTTCAAGHEHASKKEATRCNELHLLQRAGEITHLEVEPFYPFVINGAQAKHENGRRIGMRPDFSYRRRGSEIVTAEDVKGGQATRTEAYVLRAALLRHLYPHVELVEI